MLVAQFIALVLALLALQYLAFEVLSPWLWAKMQKWDAVARVKMAEHKQSTEDKNDD